MAQWVRALNAKSDNLSTFSESQVVERTNSGKLSFDLLTHTHTHTKIKHKYKAKDV